MHECTRRIDFQKFIVKPGFGSYSEVTIVFDFDLKSDEMEESFLRCYQAKSAAMGQTSISIAWSKSKYQVGITDSTAHTYMAAYIHGSAGLQRTPPHHNPYTHAFYFLNPIGRGTLLQPPAHTTTSTTSTTTNMSPAARYACPA